MAGIRALRIKEQDVSKSIISTPAAPAAIGTYSQAVKAGNTVYLSGQIPLDPVSMTLVEGGFEAQTVQMFENLKAVAEAAGGSLADAVKLTIYLTDLSNFATVNTVMARYFSEPYPARAAVGVKELPRGSLVEADAILVLGA
ncbi:RidA family protein [Niveibacterium umoris]